MTQTPADFPRAFAASFGAGDAAGLAALFAQNGSFHLLTGAFAEGPKEIASYLEAEFAGLSRMARLVTGKTSIQALSPNFALIHQRYVITGLRDEQGQELPRLGALLTVVLRQDAKGWLAQSANFAALND